MLTSAKLKNLFFTVAAIILALLTSIFLVNPLLPVQPDNLGIQTASEDLSKAVTKINTVKPISDSGYVAINTSFNSQEFTALVQKAASSSPLTDIQIKLNSDGIAETSGLLHIAKLNLDNKNANFLKPALIPLEILFPNDIPVYAQWTGSIVDNNAKFSVRNLKISGIPIPRYLLKLPDLNVNSISDNLINKMQAKHLSIKSLKIINNQIEFDAVMPADFHLPND